MMQTLKRWWGKLTKPKGTTESVQIEQRSADNSKALDSVVISLSQQVIPQNKPPAKKPAAKRRRAGKKQ